jgi:hypothetical protein
MKNFTWILTMRNALQYGFENLFSEAGIELIVF